MARRSKAPVSVLYSYKETKYAGRGIAAIILALISVLVLAALTMLSVLIPASTGPWTGAVGITGFVMAFIGMILGLESLSDPCKSYVPSKIGTILSALMVAGWFLIFCVGMAN